MERVQKPMQSLSDSTGSESPGLTPGSNGNVGQDPGLDAERLRRIVSCNAAAQANTIPLRIVMARYGYQINEQDKKTYCPFHAKGKERSPSFFWYPDTNTFYCWGCKRSGDIVGFVALHDNIRRDEAAASIIGYHGENIDLSAELRNYVHEDVKPIMEFSDAVRLFNVAHIDDPVALRYAEKHCASFDEVRAKHGLVNDKLKVLCKKYLLRLEKY